ncbi:MAG TPA: type II and III secretion system protein family protein [Methylocella sp.]|nr:type II and III secretion system protein family protein [Methylocella sp.]
MKRLIAVLAAALVASVPVPASFCGLYAQERMEAWAGGGVTPQRISMGVGKSRIVDLPRDAAEIFVANPRVANAVVRSPRKLYIIGMDAGQTSVYALDQQGRQIAALDLSIGRDIGELQQILHAAMPAAAITARTVNDTIILTGAVDSAEEAQRAGDIAKGFAQRVYGGGGPGAPGVSVDGLVVNTLTIRGRDQVMLKVTVAEIDRNIAKQLGITTSSLTANWGTFTQFNPFPINGVIAPAAVNGSNALASAAQNGTATALTATNPSNTLSATLQAFERYGVTRVLAEPTVTAVSGESAKLTVGGEIPIPGPSTCTNSGCTGGGAIFQPYGVTLRFSPVVLSEGRILLHLATEVTEIDTQTEATVYGTVVPGLLTRKNETSVEIPSGGSIASAGLLQTVSRQAINGLPGLLDLPVLGALFRSRDYQRQETELMIIVTPYIVKPVQPNEIAKPTDGFTDATDPQAWLLGRVNQLYASPGNPQAIKDYKGPVGFIQD